MPERVRVNYRSEGRYGCAPVYYCSLLVNGLSASEAVDRAHKYEDAGDSAAARETYTKAIQATPNDPELLTGYAQILERYKDPGAREAWRKSAGAVEKCRPHPGCCYARPGAWFCWI